MDFLGTISGNDLKKCDRRLGEVAGPRQFAGTKTALEGYVPIGAKKGDLIAILYGANVLFVIRNQAGSVYSGLLLFNVCLLTSSNKYLF